MIKIYHYYALHNKLSATQLGQLWCVLKASSLTIPIQSCTTSNLEQGPKLRRKLSLEATSTTLIMSTSLEAQDESGPTMAQTMGNEGAEAAPTQDNETEIKAEANEEAVPSESKKGKKKDKKSHTSAQH